MTTPNDGQIDWDELFAGAWFVCREVKSIWPSEVRDLTPWVIDNLDKLGELLGMQLEFVGREVRLSSFRADIVARDEAGRKVVIENQFGPSDHQHFAQVVLYACESEAEVVVWLAAGTPLLCDESPIRAEHQRALMKLNMVFTGRTAFFAVNLGASSEPGTSEPMLPDLSVVVRPERLPEPKR